MDFDEALDKMFESEPDYKIDEYLEKICDEIEKGNSIPGCIALIDICNTFDIAPSNLFSKYLNTNIYIASELTNSNFKNLSEYDKKLIIDLINLMANR